MLKLFERNTVVQVILILVVTLLLWAGSLAHPQAPLPSAHYTPLYDLLCALNLSPLPATLLALALVLWAGFYLNFILSKANLLAQNNLLPTLLFVLAASAGKQELSPSLLAALVVVPIVGRLMLHGTLLTIPQNKIFATAALIGIASMFYLPSLVLLLAYLLIAINYRLYNWHDWTMLLLGLMAPWIPLWAFHFLADSLPGQFDQMLSSIGPLQFSVGPFTTLQAIANSVLLAVFLVSLVVVLRRMGEKTVVWQRNSTTVMLITVAAVALLPLSQLFPVSLQFFAVPFAFSLSHRLTLRRRPTPPLAHKSWRSHLYDLLFLVTIIAAILC